MADRQYLEQLTKRFADEGKLIEAGWVGLRIMAIRENAPAAQLDEMRFAFMGGAQHLFFCIMSVLEEGAEPTETDLNRMDLIQRELEVFRKELELRATKTAGSA